MSISLCESCTMNGRSIATWQIVGQLDKASCNESSDPTECATEDDISNNWFGVQRLYSVAVRADVCSSLTV